MKCAVMNKMTDKYSKIVGLFIVVCLMVSSLIAGSVEPSSELTFSVSLSPNAYEEISNLGLETPINGRVYVIVTNDSSYDPVYQVDVTGVPFWGKDVFNFEPGSAVVLSDAEDGIKGYPLDFFSELPEGTYSAQAFLNVYTTFNKADGNTLLMHKDTGDGQWLWDSIGNACSEAKEIVIDGSGNSNFDLEISDVILPDYELTEGMVLHQGNYQDTDYVKYVKIKSDAVSEFWGSDMYIGATVLLPEGYNDNPDVKYPVLYLQGHFPGSRAPMGFKEDENNDLYKFWTSPDTSKMVVVYFQDANPYYDTSYSVNTANIGPYGDAIMDELIPYLEDNFNIVKESWGKILAGGSTGGWEAFAMKVWYPDDFGMTYVWYPDSVDFNYHQLVNIYEDENAYFTGGDWVFNEVPSCRSTHGDVYFTVKQENLYELACGTNSKSGGQWDVWDAVFGPKGEDGYVIPLWDKETGEIDKQVAEYWKENYDINYIIQQNWETLGPKLNGEVHIAVGDMDNYYLNEAVYLIKDFLDSAENPASTITFDFGANQGHGWKGWSPNNPGQSLSYTEFAEQLSDYLKALPEEETGVKDWIY